MAALDGWLIYNATLMALNAVIAGGWAAASARVAVDPTASLWAGPFGRRSDGRPAPMAWRWTVVAWLAAKALFFALIALAIVTPIPKPVGESGLTAFTAIHAFAFWRWLQLPPASPGPPPAASFRQ